MNCIYCFSVLPSFHSFHKNAQMNIAQTFAGNEGTMGNIGGAVGGFMMGGAFGGSVADIARNAFLNNFRYLKKIFIHIEVADFTYVHSLGKEISQFSQVLQFEGPVDSLVWKNPIEDFNTTVCPSVGILIILFTSGIFGVSNTCRPGPLHVGMCGNMNFLINDSRKFMLKMVGFRDAFDADSMVSKFRRISIYNKKCLMCFIYNQY